jgi:hypothetical protein
VVWAAARGENWAERGENRPGRRGNGLSKEELGWAAEREKKELGRGKKGWAREEGLGWVFVSSSYFLFYF